jgi:ABC-type Mn2+/Zn2+ transport system permease subunit
MNQFVFISLLSKFSTHSLNEEFAEISNQKLSLIHLLIFSGLALTVSRLKIFLID